MKIEIHKSQSVDLEKIQEIARRTIDSNYRSFLGDKGVDWFIESGASDQYIKENLGDCWVLFCDGQILGFYVDKKNLIELMMVDTELHRKGFGAELLKHCEGRLFKEYEKIKLESFEGNENANNFYKKHGWKETDRIFDKTSGTYKLTFIKKK